jgi:hypothetical protein
MRIEEQLLSKAASLRALSDVLCVALNIDRQPLAQKSGNVTSNKKPGERAARCIDITPTAEQ